MKACTFGSTFGMVLALAAGGAVAAPVYIDFGDGADMSGGGANGGVASGPDGNQWNVIHEEADLGSSSSTPIALTDAEGNSSGWTMTNVSFAFTLERGHGQLFNGSPESWAINEATGDWFRLQAGDGITNLRVRFTGFDPGRPYDFSLISSNLFGPADYRGIFKLNGQAADGLGPNEVFLSGTENTTEILKWSSVAPDVNGVLELTGTGAADAFAGSYLVLNAIRIAEVPEPSTLALAGAGSVLILVRRRNGFRA